MLIKKNATVTPKPISNSCVFKKLRTDYKTFSDNIALTFSVTFDVMAMKRLSLFLLLLLHLNFSVFIPQFDEVDRRGKNGVVVDDINSLAEFIDQVVLGHKDTTPEDEDNDQARHFHASKAIKYYFQEVVIIKTIRLETPKASIPLPKQEGEVSSIYFEIPSPPPKA